MKIKKAIIPAAGLGTRFLPVTKSQPKEMLPIVDKPCIQYLVEEAVASGIHEIIIVTGRGKRSIEDYFDFSFELDAHLRKNGQIKMLKEIERIQKMAKFAYVRQPFPLGDGHAILCAKELVENEPFAVLFGDDIYDSEVPPLKQMIALFNEVQAPVIALQKIDKKDSEKYGMVKSSENKNHDQKTQIKLPKNAHEIGSLIEKPHPSKTPSNLAITGKYIITPELLKTLHHTKPGKDKELRLINGMQEFVKKSPIYGLEVEGQRFDTGDKLGYLKAVVSFALKHPEVKKDFREFLKNI